MPYDNTNSGAMFDNDRREHDRHPDYKGSLEVKCPCCNKNSEFWVSSWIKTAGPSSKNPGSEFFSIAIAPKEDNQSRPTPNLPSNRKLKKKNTSPFSEHIGSAGDPVDDDFDDVPF